MIRPDILTAITAEIDRAQREHGPISNLPEYARVRVLLREVREVSDAIDYCDVDGPNGIREELTQVAACAIAWLSTLPVPTPEPQCCGYGACGPDCLCLDAALCAGTCSNPEHVGRGQS